VPNADTITAASCVAGAKERNLVAGLDMVTGDELYGRSKDEESLMGRRGANFEKGWTI
jgi:hypothetical protein